MHLYQVFRINAYGSTGESGIYVVVFVCLALGCGCRFCILCIMLQLMFQSCRVGVYTYLFSLEVVILLSLPIVFVCGDSMYVGTIVAI